MRRAKGFRGGRRSSFSSHYFRRFHGVRNHWHAMAGFDPLNAFVFNHVRQWASFLLWITMLQRYVNMGWKWFPTVALMCG